MMADLPPLPAVIRLSRGQGVTRLPLEAWVSGVVAAETPAGSPQAGREAQAVLARTLAWRGGDHPEGSLCGTTHCMAWTAASDPGARAAAERTRGWVLAAGNKIAFPACHASCGGHTAGWPAGFAGVSDPACLHDRWVRFWPRTWLDEVLPGPATLRVLHTPDGRVYQMRRGAAWRDGEVFGVLVGRRHGWHAVPSTAFEVRPRADGWLATGSGRGHGKGMCQRGAERLARQGRSWQEILRHYMPWARPVRTAVALAAAGWLGCSVSPAVAQPMPEKLAVSITTYARAVALGHFLGNRPAVPADLAHLPPGGVFVTWSKAGRTRACWGRLEADQPGLAAQIAQEAVRSLDHDPRTPPLSSLEVRALDLLVSLPDRPRPLPRLSWLMPTRQGLLLEAAGRKVLVLPGEAASPSGMLLRCRDKAGISRRVPARLWSFTTRTAWSGGRG